MRPACMTLVTLASIALCPAVRARELTANATYDSAPAWSPDGRWITYTAEDSQGVNLMLLNVVTGESSRLT